MDIFAGYGSEDSASNQESETEPKEKSEGLNGLLGLYSDNDESDESSIPTPTTHSNERKIKMDLHDKNSKKKKLNIDAFLYETTENGSLSLPPAPPLSTEKMNPFDAMIYFSKDYMRDLPPVLSEQNNQNNSSIENQERLEKKLDDMFQNFYGDMQKTVGKVQAEKHSFASNLRSKKEFGNPQMFKSVVSHFDIDEYASNILEVEGSYCSKGKPWKKFEYVDRIVAGESQAALIANTSEN